MTDRTCTVADCGEAIGSKGARGMCPRHYQRWLRTGEAQRFCETCGNPVTRNRRFCSSACMPRCAVAECDGPARKRGWCAAHYAQARSTGQSPSPFRWFWNSDHVSYSAVHERLQQQRGSATAHSCDHCGGPAHHWAYGHTDPQQKRSREGPYSTDLNHYMPLCRSCHKHFDLAHAG